MSAIVAQKPGTFCLPARLDGASPSDADARRACYRGKTAAGAPRPSARTLAVTDAFGAAMLSAAKPTSWCQPAAESD